MILNILWRYVNDFWPCCQSHFLKQITGILVTWGAPLKHAVFCPAPEYLTFSWLGSSKVVGCTYKNDGFLHAQRGYSNKIWSFWKSTSNVSFCYLWSTFCNPYFLFQMARFSLQINLSWSISLLGSLLLHQFHVSICAKSRTENVCKLPRLPKYPISLPINYAEINFCYRQFESVCMFCESHSGFIPLTFVLAFYVSLVVTRWWWVFGTTRLMAPSAPLGSAFGGGALKKFIKIVKKLFLHDFGPKNGKKFFSKKSRKNFEFFPGFLGNFFFRHVLAQNHVKLQFLQFFELPTAEGRA